MTAWNENGSGRYRRDLASSEWPRLMVETTVEQERELRCIRSGLRPNLPARLYDGTLILYAGRGESYSIERDGTTRRYNK